MSFYFLDVPYLNTYGLCNQLYSIVGMCSYALENNIKYIFINHFLKEINTDNYCPISEIIDIKQTNLLLKKYNYDLVLFDYQKFNFVINYVKYGNNQFNIDVTDIAVSKFRNKNNFVMLTSDNLLKIFGIQSIDQDTFIYINFQVDETVFNYTLDCTRNGFLKTNININLNNVMFSSSKRYFNACTSFINLLRNIPFSDNIVSKANDYFKSFDNTKKINVIHLRLEDDAVQHWGMENNYKDFSLYKQNVENKYIDLIKKNISKDDITILICYDYNNNVVKYLNKNKFNYFKTPKFDNNRDVSAIIDMHIGQYCNNVYIGVFESTFSFTLLTRIYNKTNFKPLMFELNNLDNDPISLDDIAK
jgi:hypothetical protein